MVGCPVSRIAGRSRPRIPQMLVVGVQTVDGSGTCLGMDQHKNYFGCCLLLRRNPYRIYPALAG